MADKVSSDFELEKQCIKNKYLNVYFPYNLIQSTFNSYQHQKFESLIRNWLFEEKYRKTIYIRIPFCQSNEHYSFNPFSTEKIEKLDFADANNSTNFKN